MPGFNEVFNNARTQHGAGSAGVQSGFHPIQSLGALLGNATGWAQEHPRMATALASLAGPGGSIAARSTINSLNRNTPTEYQQNNPSSQSNGNWFTNLFSGPNAQPAYQAIAGTNPFAGATSSGSSGYQPPDSGATVVPWQGSLGNTQQAQATPHGNSYSGHSYTAPGLSSGGGIGGSWGSISSAQLSQLISGLTKRDHSQMSPGMQADVLTNVRTGEVREGNGPSKIYAQRAIERNRAAQALQALQ